MKHPALKHAKLVISLIIICLFGGTLISCDEEKKDAEPGTCQDPPDCLPVVADWKLAYKPHNSECTTCHTYCQQSFLHVFCKDGEFSKTEDDFCKRCHDDQHLETEDSDSPNTTGHVCQKCHDGEQHLDLDDDFADTPDDTCLGCHENEEHPSIGK